jgi:hypothetical protein
MPWRLQSSFSRLGKSQSTDREGDQWSEKWQKPIKWRD